MKLFSKRETCCICKKERVCAGLLGLTNDPSGKQKLIPDDLPEGKKERLIRAYRHHAESYACEECARKEGRNPSALLVLWIISLILMILVFAIGFAALKLPEETNFLVGFSILPTLAFMATGVALTVKAYRYSPLPGLVMSLLAVTPLALVTVPLACKRLKMKNLVRTSLAPYVQKTFAQLRRADIKPEEVCRKEGHLWQEDWDEEGSNEETGVRWHDRYYLCSRCGQVKVVTKTIRDGRETNDRYFTNAMPRPGNGANLCRRLATGHRWEPVSVRSESNEEADIRSSETLYRCPYCGQTKTGRQSDAYGPVNAMQVFTDTVQRIMEVKE